MINGYVAMDTKAAVTVFRGYLLEKGKCADFTSLPLEELRELLKKITLKPEEKNKNMYSKSSLIAIMFGLCKCIQFHRPELDINNGSNFNIIVKCRNILCNKINIQPFLVK